MNVLAIGAHPDDVELLMIGTLAACRARGDAVGWIVATDGSRGGTGRPADIAATRRAEARRAGMLLEVEPSFLGERDGELQQDRATQRKLAALVAAVAPDVILTHSPDDYHPDHRNLSALVRMVAGYDAPVLYADCVGGGGFVPGMFVDIAVFADLKRRAINTHLSQDPGRLIAIADLVGRFRALQANGLPDGYAEAFRFEMSYPFGDVRHMLPAPPPMAGR